MSHHLNRFERLVLGADNHIGPVVLYLLLWVARCDRPADSRKTSLLKDIANDLEAGPLYEDVAALAGKDHYPHLELAVGLGQAWFDDALADTVLEMAVQVAVVDGRLTPAENVTLRFLADALGGADLAAIFQRATGRALPEPSDISAAAWWQRREAAGGERRGADAGGRPRPRPAGQSEALAVLGLDEGASGADIRRAYRKLAGAYHPDKHAAFGEQATARATAAFQRIQAAYHTLMR
jgi:DnaJ-domain-containing protein 1